MCKQLSALAKKKSDNFEENLETLREAMGVMQHHDAVTGTEKQHVANDYARLLQIGIDKCSENVKESLNQFTANNDNSEKAKNEKFKFEFKSCPDLNISSCDVSENSEKFMVTFYNPLAHSTHQYVRVPVSDSEYEVFDHKNTRVISQTVSIPNEIQILSFRPSKASSELVFLATELPPLGYKSYYIQKKTSEKVAKSKMIDNKISQFLSEPFTIGNGQLNLKFNENGLLESAQINGAQMKVRQNFYYYRSAVGTNWRPEQRSSGAYIFRPNQTSASPISFKALVQIVRGDLVDEVHQVNF